MGTRLSQRSSLVGIFLFLALLVFLSISFLPSYGLLIRQHILFFGPEPAPEGFLGDTLDESVGEADVWPDSVLALPTTDDAAEIEAVPDPELASTTTDEVARYVFTFGDSLTSTGFAMAGLWPTKDSPFGNPATHASSATGPNWLDDLITASPPNTLNFNFADGGAVVDVDIARPPLSLIPFNFQVQNFTSVLGIEPRPERAPWVVERSVAVIWFGVNDVSAVQVYTDQATPTSIIGRIMASYFEQVGNLVRAGLQRFVFLGVPPLHHFPFANNPEYEHLANLTSSCTIWNQALEAGAEGLRENFQDVKADVVLTDGFFNEAISNPERYGASNATCSDRDGESCLWVDTLHPGVRIARLVGLGVYTLLSESGFFEGNFEENSHPG